MGHMIVNQKAWDALPKEYQAAYQAACGDCTGYTMAKYDHLNPIALRKLVAGGAQLRSFSRGVMDACYKASQAQYAEWSDKHPEFKTLYASHSKAQAELTQWFRIAEGSFDNYMSSRRG